MLLMIDDDDRESSSRWDGVLGVAGGSGSGGIQAELKGSVR